MARVVIDTNVLISAAFGGTPLDAVARAFAVGEVVRSPQVDAELETTKRRLASKLGSERCRAIMALWSRLRARCTLVVPTPGTRICRDPKDEAYRALCVAAEADILITGDRDLLVIDPDRHAILPGGMKIVTPRQFPELP